MLVAIKLPAYVYILEKYKKRHLPVDQITVSQCPYKLKRFGNKNVRLKIDLCPTKLDFSINTNIIILYTRTYLSRAHIIPITYI